MFKHPQSGSVIHDNFENGSVISVMQQLQ